jgi:hypothetical protein
MCWACHRKCRHCYEDRFRPYVRDALQGVIAEAERNAPRIIESFPEQMTYLSPDGDGFVEKPGRIILSGGEALIDGVRERVTYPTIEALRRRYSAQVKIIVQTTGDVLSPAILDDLLARGVWLISIASIDDYHVGLEGAERKQAFMDRLAALFQSRGVARSGQSSPPRSWLDEEGPLYDFFGAAPDSWIGKLWPRGRAWSNDLSTATLADNFCNRWSGGLNFLNHRYAGSEVSVEPDGSVYPCCIKTKLPLGNLLEERLIDLLDSLAGDPVYEAINAGKPERMGLQHGWTVEDFLAKSTTHTPAGRTYRNLCIGCDRFHEEVLGALLERRRAARRSGAV